MEASENIGAELIRIESYGVRINIRVDDPELVPRVLAVMPPSWSEAADSFPDAEFSIWADKESRYVVRGDGTGRISQPVDLEVALSFLEGHIRTCTARWAPELIFVHAGVVTRNGRALVIPGDSFSGKTTLVAALVTAGATYFSDEFAVCDAEGFVRPFAKPLSIRSPTGGPTENVPAGALGGATGDGRAPVALVAVTSYLPDALWEPKPAGPGETALALLSHTVPAQERPAEVLRVLRRVAEQCACVRSDRGEAESIVDSLLSLLEAS